MSKVRKQINSGIFIQWNTCTNYIDYKWTMALVSVKTNLKMFKLRKKLPKSTFI